MFVDKTQFEAHLQKQVVEVARKRSRKHRLFVRRFCYWVVPENIHTHTTGGISEFQSGGGLRRLEFRGHGGVHWTGIPKAWGDFHFQTSSLV